VKGQKDSAETDLKQAVSGVAKISVSIADHREVERRQAERCEFQLVVEVIVDEGGEVASRHAGGLRCEIDALSNGSGLEQEIPIPSIAE